jgi:hypothetical protein
MTTLRFFTKPDCSLCDAALYVVRRVQRWTPLELEIVDISAPGNEPWLDAYRHDIPVLHVNGTEAFRHRVDERALREMLEASPPTASDRPATP